MSLSTLAIQDFQELYKNHFGTDLNTEEANDFGLELLNFFRLIYRPVPKAYAWQVQPIMPVYELN